MSSIIIIIQIKICPRQPPGTPIFKTWKRSKILGKQAAVIRRPATSLCPQPVRQTSALLRVCVHSLWGRPQHWPATSLCPQPVRQASALASYESVSTACEAGLSTGQLRVCVHSLRGRPQHWPATSLCPQPARQASALASYESVSTACEAGLSTGQLRVCVHSLRGRPQHWHSKGACATPKEKEDRMDRYKNNQTNLTKSANPTYSSSLVSSSSTASTKLCFYHQKKYNHRCYESYLTRKLLFTTSAATV